MNTKVISIALAALALAACNKLIDSAVVANEAERGVTKLITSSTGRTLEPISIDAPVTTASTDSILFASIWAASCPNFGGDPMQQWLLSVIDGQLPLASDGKTPLTRANDYGNYRSLSLAAAAPAGKSYDLAVRCSTPLTYPVAKKLSLGTSSGQSPVSREPEVMQTAESDGLVAAFGMNNNLGKLLRITAEVNGKRVAFSADSGTDIDRPTKRAHANVTFPVHAGDSYIVRYTDDSGNTAKTNVDRIIQFQGLPDLGVGAAESRSAHTEYTAESDGFILASGSTGKCQRDGFAFQQVDGYVIESSGQRHRMAVESDYGLRRSLSILYPVLKGMKYLVGAYCPGADVQMAFYPLR